MVDHNSNYKFRIYGKGGRHNVSNVTRYNSYLSQILPGYGEYDSTDRNEIANNIIRYTLARTQQIFKWHNLPDSIPARMLELYLQMNGNCAFYRYNGNVYVYTGGLGGIPNEYYMPTIYVITNPFQKLTVEAKIDKECVVMPNDSLYIGLIPLIKRYAYNMADTEISLYDANINTRIIALISAQNDNTKKSAEKYINDILDGKLGIIAESAFFDDLKTTPFMNNGAHNIITDLIELMQYNKASLFNEIGLNANYNMKRESINSGESQLNNDALSPLIDDMFSMRKLYADKVNKMFGLNISVELNSAWKDNKEEIEAEKEALREYDKNNTIEGGQTNEEI